MDVYCPELGRRNLVHVIERSKAYGEKVAAEKIISTDKKELRFFARLIQLGHSSYKLPKFKFKSSGIKFQEGQILEVINNHLHPPYRLPCKVALYTGMRKENIWGLRKKYVDLKGREVRFTLNEIPKPMDDLKFN